MDKDRADSAVAIVGYGAVGKALHTIFPSAVVHDEPLKIGSRAEVNRCRVAFIAVPTPPAADGSCNTSTVDDVMAWLDSDLVVLRSTVPPGTTDRIKWRTGKRVVFQPEYGPGETPQHHFSDLRQIGWIILGGDREDTKAVADLYKTAFNADLIIQQTDAATAELVKYMENSFLALKVTFCNEFYDLAERLGIDYNELRELWLLDPRMGRAHTFVLPDDRGFGGKCLPKDVSAIIEFARVLDCQLVLLQAMQEVNARLRASRSTLNASRVSLVGTDTYWAPATDGDTC